MLRRGIVLLVLSQKLAIHCCKQSIRDHRTHIIIWWTVLKGSYNTHCCGTYSITGIIQHTALVCSIARIIQHNTMVGSITWITQNLLLWYSTTTTVVCSITGIKQHVTRQYWSDHAKHFTMVGSIVQIIQTMLLQCAVLQGQTTLTSLVCSITWIFQNMGRYGSFTTHVLSGSHNTYYLSRQYYKDHTMLLQEVVSQGSGNTLLWQAVLQHTHAYFIVRGN